MISDTQPGRTRIWWDGNEVEFIRWTDRGVLFNWGDPRETAVHMPRGAVARLLEKGVLRIEGEGPTWSNSGQSQRERPAEIVPVHLAQPESTPPRVEKLASQPPPNRASIITRLIRKLAGSEEPKRVNATH